MCFACLLRPNGLTHFVLRGCVARPLVPLALDHVSFLMSCHMHSFLCLNPLDFPTSHNRAQRTTRIVPIPGGAARCERVCCFGVVVWGMMLGGSAPLAQELSNAC